MRRTVIIIPELLGSSDSDSPLRQTLPSIRALAESSRITKVSPLPPIETPEALVLGLGPDEGQLRQGPLTISALGADPPEKSTHFHLSWLTAEDGRIIKTDLRATAEEELLMLERAPKLNTKTLTFVPGHGQDHGLVCEAKVDMGTTSPENAYGKPIRNVRPDGDGESMLRRYIDDSINLFSELPFNLERLDQGLPPLNLLWPWGHGFRLSVPNLALIRGERATVESPSMRLQGLTRLTGYVHATRDGFGQGLRTRLQLIAQRALTRDLTIIWIPALSELKAPSAESGDREEEKHWFVRELDRELIGPLLTDALKNRDKLFLTSPGDSLGLALEMDGREVRTNSIPFDERALDETGIPRTTLWESVKRGVAW